MMRLMSIEPSNNAFRYTPSRFSENVTSTTSCLQETQHGCEVYTYMYMLYLCVNANLKHCHKPASDEDFALSDELDFDASACSNEDESTVHVTAIFPVEIGLLGYTPSAPAYAV